MRDDFGCLLLQGITLLRGLPGEYGSVPSARALAAEWSRKQPGLHAELLAYQEPGAARVEYDLLVDHPDGGTLALTWRPDDGVPWSVSHSQHWAANFVLTVNGESVTVQEALRILRMSAQAHPDLLAELVDQKLLLRTLHQDQPSVADQELQDAADRFRRAKGLFPAADMHRWLRDTGLTTEQFEALVRITVQVRKLKHRLSAERIEPHFGVHRDLYDRIRYFQVDDLDEATAADLLSRAREIGLLAAAGKVPADGVTLPRFEGALETCFAHQLPDPLRTSRGGEIVGPFGRDGNLSLAQVLGRQQAVLDDETRAAVQDTVFGEWLAQQREAATVEWHWT